MPRILRAAGAGIALAAFAACQSSSSTAPPRTQPGYGAPPPYYGQPYPNGQPPPPGYGPPPYAGQPGYPPPGQPPPGQGPQPPPGRPLLPPLVGTVMWQAEVRGVIAEIIANLSPDRAARVRGIPVVFEMNPGDINAFAGCDDNGAPFIAGTEGLLEAVDAMSQTKAADEMFGMRTYDAYTNAVMPGIAQGQGASAALPQGLIPPQVLLDPRRLSRAHEMFDEIVAFTFGHELGHHYLGHTGCANGQPMGNGPNLAQLGQLAASVLPIVNQPNEIAADNVGVLSTLDTGYARRMTAYRWTEQGAFTLLDFFTRLESAAGITPLSPVGFLRSHPNSGLRLPLVQAAAATWHFQHQA